MSESKTTVKRDAEIEVPRNTTCLRCFRQVAPGDGVGSGIGFRCKSCSESERTREREALDETLGYLKALKHLHRMAGGIKYIPRRLRLGWC